MRTPPPTILAPAAAGAALLYVVSKVHLALAGRLGVTGGPEVPVEHYAAFGPGEVAAAQWGNAAIGLAGALLLLAPLLPAARRLPRMVLTAPIAAFALMATTGAVGMLARAALTDAGGAGFGAYCAVWAALVGATALAHHRRRAPRARRSAGQRGSGQRSGSPVTREMSAPSETRFSTNRG